LLSFSGLTIRSISLGKFGSFLTNELIGKPFGPSWEILPDKKLKLLEREIQDEEGSNLDNAITDLSEEAVMRDNRDVFDDGTAQQLSTEEIVAVRKTMSSKVVCPSTILIAGDYFNNNG